jgi:predicted RNA-binding protein with PIN domain
VIPRPPDRTDPLAAAERLIVDGSNLLYALARGRATPAPAATLIGRLRGAIPPAVRIELVFDGPPDHGLRGTRIASGLTVRYSGRVSADSLIDRLVADAIGTGGTAEAAHAAGWAILVVTDDIELGRAIRHRGGRTVGAAWLVRRLDRPTLSGPGIGLRRAPRPTTAGDPTGGGHSDDGDDDIPRWQPGRGATRKTGNPRRGRPRPQNRPG